MSDEGSFDFAADESLHIAPIASTAARRHDNKLFASANPDQLPTKDKALPVLTFNKDSNKPSASQIFEEYLAEDDANLDAVIVSILGPKKIGKSFLLDSLLTVENGKVTRLMSKSSKPIINSPAHNSRTRNGDRIIYFDSEGESTSEIFLWNYFLSSVMIYNLSPNDRNEELNLIDHLSFVQSHLDSDIDDLSPPQLIIVRRDAENKEINDRDLLRKIQQYGLFCPDILVIHLPFPGNKDVKSKEVVDVPLKEISSKYQGEVERLSQVLKSGKAKIIRGNYLSTKILSLTLGPLTRGLNKDHRVSTSKIWDDVVETLSIGFYNFYIKSYSEELDKEFETEKPCDKYTVYKRLNKLKRRVDKKVQGFKNISQDPIFVRYKQKLDETIKSKEQLVRDVNQAKSRAANEAYCRRLLSELNASNCAQLIDEYCKSQLDDQKTEVLLENFEVIIREKSKEAEFAKNPGKRTSLEIVELEKELMKIEKEIEVASKPQDLPNYSEEVQKLRKQTKLKEKKLKELEDELEDLRNVSQVMSKEKADEELERLEAQCEQLNEDIAKCDKEIVQLRKSREEKMRDTILRLEKQAKKEEDQLRRLEQQLREIQQMKPKQGKADTGKKDTCCSLM